MILSQVHNWQNDKAVKQILVFASAFDKQDFEKAFSYRVAEVGIDEANDSSIGAIFKLRAVRDGNRKYIPILRTGSGYCLWEGEPTEKWESALLMAYNHMMVSFINTDNFETVMAPIINACNGGFQQ